MIALFNEHRVAILVIADLIAIGAIYLMVCHQDPYQPPRR